MSLYEVNTNIPLLPGQKHVRRPLLIDFAAELERVLPLQHRGIVLQLVHIDDSPLRKACRHAEANAILRGGTNQDHVCRAIRGVSSNCNPKMIARQRNYWPASS